MEFAGKDLIYLSKQKKEKIKKIKEELVPFSKSKKDEDLNSEDSDDAYIQVDSKNFNIDLEKSNVVNPMNLMPAPPSVQFKKAIDKNACVIRFNTLEKESENIATELYKCEKCNSYLNKYSILTPLPEKDKYEWKCEFCFHINKNIYIEKNNLPKNDCIEECILKPETKKEGNKGDDSSLIFCLDNSGSMDQTYYIDEKLREKFSKIREYNSGNISRLEMVKIAVENIINSLLKKSPKVKVGLVTFQRRIEVKGDCLSNVMIINGEDLNNESKLMSLGKENTNLIKSEINKSYKEIIDNLRNIKGEGSTALGPAALFSLYLLDRAKSGSRIFLCTDGLSNQGVGNIINLNRESAIQFYTKIGNIAKEKGIVISLIGFEDCESEIDVLKHMVENSGGDIFRVNPEYILDEVNDFLENMSINCFGSRN